jgi:O-methyltransferase involved in polyketide biosynthesis
MEAYRLAGRPNLEMMLLARNKQIDEILAGEIEAGRVRQVIEIAAGFSARGWRFMQRYRHLGLSYIEGDLPDHAAEKRRILDGANLRGPDHEVLALDALVDRGACSLPEIAQERSRGAGTAIITEGPLGYFDRETVTTLWARISGVLRSFRHGV